jgi:hypothetical protein
MSTLLAFFSEAEDLLKLYFNACFTPANYAANKALVELVRQGKLGLSVKVRLADSKQRLCWEHFELVRAKLARIPLCVVTEIDCYYTECRKNVLFPKRRRWEKFDEVAELMRDLIEKNSAHLEAIACTMKCEHDTDVSCRLLTWPVDLPRVVRVKVDNRSFVTARVLRMLRRMPALEHVAIRGGFVMTMQDVVCEDDPLGAGYKSTRGYSILNPPVLETVFPVLGRSIRTLDLNVCLSSGMAQLVQEFGAAVLQGKFDKLERLSLGATFRRMTRRQGEAFVEFLPLCLALKRLEVGCSGALLYMWQQRALDSLGARCPELDIDRSRGSSI